MLPNPYASERLCISQGLLEVLWKQCVCSQDLSYGFRHRKTKQALWSHAEAPGVTGTDLPSLLLTHTPDRYSSSSIHSWRDAQRNMSLSIQRILIKLCFKVSTKIWSSTTVFNI